MYGKDGPPSMDASHAQDSAELKAALMSNALGGAIGLVKAILHGIPSPHWHVQRRSSGCQICCSSLYTA